MNSQWVSSEVQLNANVFQRQAYSLIPNQITFRNNRWINIPYMPKWDPGLKYSAYDVSSSFNTIYPVGEKKDLVETGSGKNADVNPQDSYFSMRFTQNSRTKTISSTREAVSNTFQRFGSYLALCLRFIGYILGAYQRFSLDNSMTKKLYNYVNNSSDESAGDANPPTDDGNFRNNLLHEVRDRRRPFRYSMWRFFMKKNMSSPWCFCCKHEDSDADKLQGKARTRLYSELDICSIIQKLRVARFVAELTITPEQHYLVNYHTEYMLFRDDDQAPNVDFGRYTDHRSAQPDAARDQRLASNAADAVMQLDSNDASHQKTYKKIMARNSPPEEQFADMEDDAQDGGNAGGPQVEPRAQYGVDSNRLL